MDVSQTTCYDKNTEYPFSQIFDPVSYHQCSYMLNHCYLTPKHFVYSHVLHKILFRC